LLPGNAKELMQGGGVGRITTQEKQSQRQGGKETSFQKPVSRPFQPLLAFGHNKLHFISGREGKRWHFSSSKRQTHPPPWWWAIMHGWLLFVCEKWPCGSASSQTRLSFDSCRKQKTRCAMKELKFTKLSFIN